MFETPEQELVRLRGVCVEQQKQIVRAIDLRVQAQRAAGKRRIPEYRERIKRLETIVQVLRDAVDAGRFKSCAHLADSLRECMLEHDAEHLKTDLEELFGIGIEEMTEERRAALKAQGLL